MTVKKQFRHLLDWFLPSGLREDISHQNLLRARVMIGVLLVNLAITLFICATVLVLFDLKGRSHTLTTWVTACTGAMYLACLLYFKYSGKLVRVANLYAFLAATSITAPVLIAGGAGVLPSLPLLIVVPVWAFLMTGRQYGLVWTAIIAIEFSLLSLMSQLGIKLPVLMEPEMTEAGSYMVLLMALGMTAACINIYELHFERLTQKLERDKLKYAFDALHDPLTGLANRTGFELRAQEALAYAMQERMRAALVYIDLDNFKPINDRYGHAVGDEVLRIISRRLKAAVRASDTVARLGGDEFAVVLHAVANRQTVDELVNRMLWAIGEPTLIQDSVFRVSASLGVVLAPENGSTVDELLRGADQAMYEAKKEKNRVVYFHTG